MIKNDQMLIQKLGLFYSYKCLYIMIYYIQFKKLCKQVLNQYWANKKNLWPKQKNQKGWFKKLLLSKFQQG